ncbi:NCS2 family permease [Rickettsiales bacterium LUAb2]
MLEYLFKLKANNSSISSEVTAGFSTFLTMVYIIFVNPIILSSTGIPISQVFIATCIMIGIACCLVAFFTNLPLAMGPGMGLNAIFAYDIVANLHYSYHTALMVVFLSGLVSFVIFLVVPSKNIINAIPENLKSGIVAGTGIFLIIIGLNLSKFIVSSNNTLVTLGNIHSIPVIFTFVLFLIMSFTYHKKFYFTPILIFIAAIVFNIINISHQNTLHSLIEQSKLSNIHFKLFDFNLSDFHLSLLGIIITLFFASNFDSIGTFISYNETSKQNIKQTNKLLKKLLLIKGVSSMLAGIAGTSNMTIFLESNVGVKNGGKTGLTALTIGVLFISSLMLQPLLAFIPSWSSSPILLCIGFLMLQSSLAKLKFTDYTDYLPAIVAMLFIPLTYSITNGIAISLISYIIIKTINKKYREIYWLSYVLAFLFALYLIV